MRGTPCGGEAAPRAGQEPGAGGALLVGQDLGVGQPGVVVDHGVDVVEAHGPVTAGGVVARPWTRHPPPSGMRPSFLTSTCTSRRVRGARSGGRCAASRGSTSPVTGSQSANRGTPWRCRIREIVRAGTPVLRAPAAPARSARRGARSAPGPRRRRECAAGSGAGRLERSCRPARAVLVVALHPAVRALPRHPELGGDVSDRAGVEADTLHQQRAAMQIQTGVSVHGWKALRGEADGVRHLHPARRAFPRSTRHAVTPHRHQRPPGPRSPPACRPGPWPDDPGRPPRAAAGRRRAPRSPRGRRRRPACSSARRTA